MYLVGIVLGQTGRWTEDDENEGDGKAGRPRCDLEKMVLLRLMKVLLLLSLD